MYNTLLNDTIPKILNKSPKLLTGLNMNSIQFHEYVRDDLQIIMKIAVFYDVTPCILVELYWCFREKYCLLHQGS
jgi:hypothetical protein